MGETRFSPHVLAIDAPAEACRIARAVEVQVLARLRRRGLVVGVSGGVDSAVVVALAALAVGGARVLALLLPERDSSPESLTLGRMMAARLGLTTEVVDLGAVLEASGCYAEQTAAIRTVRSTTRRCCRCRCCRSSPRRSCCSRRPCRSCSPPSTCPRRAARPDRFSCSPLSRPPQRTAPR
jgi:NAD+ synthase